MAAISCDSANQLETLNAKNQFGKVQANAMIDSRSVVGLITKMLAKRILRTTPSAKWVTTKKIFSNEPIKVLGQLATMVTYNDWTCNDAHLTVLEGGLKIIIGRDLFNSLGLAVFQQQAEIGKCVNSINNSTCKIKDTIAAKFPYLVSRIGLSKTHVAKSKFHQKFRAKHQRGRSKAPEKKLQTRVTADLDRLQTKGQIEKLSSCSDEHFISPIVITLKKDQSIKLALDSKVLNKVIHKNKYQMPNTIMLKDSISQHLTNTQKVNKDIFQQ